MNEESNGAFKLKASISQKLLLSIVISGIIMYMDDTKASSGTYVIVTICFVFAVYTFCSFYSFIHKKMQNWFFSFSIAIVIPAFYMSIVISGVERFISKFSGNDTDTVSPFFQVVIQNVVGIIMMIVIMLPFILDMVKLARASAASQNSIENNSENNVSDKRPNSNKNSRGIAWAYERQDSLLTDREKKVYDLLLPFANEFELNISPKVRLADLVKVKDNVKNEGAFFSKIMAKHIDFVLSNKEHRPVIAVEVDDKSHEAPDRVKSDEFKNDVLEANGIIVARIKKYSKTDINNELEFIFSHICPLCHGLLLVRKNKESNREFVGCSNYRHGSLYSCNYTREIYDHDEDSIGETLDESPEYVLENTVKKKRLKRLI